MTYTINTLNKKFTELVQNYIENGYTFHIQSMSGTQGEIASVDMVKENKDIIKIYMDKGCDAVVMYVKRYKYKKYNSINTIIWNNDEDIIIEKYVYYDISNKYQYFTDDKNYADKCYNKHMKRYNDRRSDNEHIIHNSALLDIVKQHTGYKRAISSTMKPYINCLKKYYRIDVILSNNITKSICIAYNKKWNE